MRLLSKRDRTTLLAGAGVVAAILLFGRGVPALQRWQSERLSEAEAARDRLGVLRAGAESSALLRDSVAARGRRLNSTRARLLSGATVEAAAASLASVVEKTGRENGVDVMTVSLRPDSVRRGAFARVAVHLSAEGDVDGLADLLYALESSDRLLAVRALSVTQTDPTANEARPETLRLELTVEALARVAPKVATGGRR